MLVTQKPHVVRVDGTDWLAPGNAVRCTVCHDNLGYASICPGGHPVLCPNCFAGHFHGVAECPVCRSTKLSDRQTAESSININRYNLNNSLFHCQAEGCQWQGGAHELNEHRGVCRQKIACRHDGCDEKLFHMEMALHQKQCNKRPYQLGQLKGTYGDIKDAQQLETELQEATNDPLLTLEQAKRLLGQAAKIYKPVLTAALTEPPAPEQTTKTIRCQYQCGFIASTHEQLSVHLLVCAHKPVACQYCQQHIQQNNITHHEANCDLRTETCDYCRESLHPLLIKAHKQNCQRRPVSCNMCHEMQPFEELEHHKQSLCPKRIVTCTSCLTPRNYSNPLPCWCKRSILLTNRTALRPQNDANCPVYQETKKDDSTIYLAARFDRFQHGFNQPDESRNVFRPGAQFTFCNRAATVTWTKEPAASAHHSHYPVIHIQAIGHNSRGEQESLCILEKQECIPAKFFLFTNKATQMLPLCRREADYFPGSSTIHRDTVHVFHSGIEGQACFKRAGQGGGTDQLDTFFQGHTDSDIVLVKVQAISQTGLTDRAGQLRPVNDPPVSLTNNRGTTSE